MLLSEAQATADRTVKRAHLPGVSSAAWFRDLTGSLPTTFVVDHDHRVAALRAAKELDSQGVVSHHIRVGR
jgi:hypothetical protein